MGKTRLEAFSDGVIAILITIMVLELKAPVGEHLRDIRPILGQLAAYAMSFAYLGIYWNNHHHLMAAVRKVNGAILWANMHLLFWLSLVPIGTLWMGETHYAVTPVAVYGLLLTAPAAAYYILVQLLIAQHGAGSTIATAIGADRKGKVSIAIYVAGVLATLTINPILGIGAYVLVALIWLVPDKRIEDLLMADDAGSE